MIVFPLVPFFKNKAFWEIWEWFWGLIFKTQRNSAILLSFVGIFLNASFELENQPKPQEKQMPNMKSAEKVCVNMWQTKQLILLSLCICVAVWGAILSCWAPSPIFLAHFSSILALPTPNPSGKKISMQPGATCKSCGQGNEVRKWCQEGPSNHQSVWEKCCHMTPASCHLPQGVILAERVEDRGFFCLIELHAWFFKLVLWSCSPC